jgi:hypothetical protein
MGDVLVYLDVLASFSEATVTARKAYVRPVLHYEDAGMMMLDQVRHPCLEFSGVASLLCSQVTNIY